MPQFGARTSQGGVAAMPKPDEKGLSLEYLRAKLAGIVDEWRETPKPTDEQVERWATLVMDLNVRIAATEVARPEE